MSPRRIDGPADLAEGAAHLARVCPVWAATLPGLGPLPLRRRAEGFAALLDIIVGQQLSTHAAAAISARLAAAGLTEGAAFAAAPDTVLRGCGLSRPKIAALRGLVAAAPDWAALARMEDAEATAALIALPGVGRWTAEIYLMFALGRPDVFAPGDLALREAVRLLYALPHRPTPAALDVLAAPWRPWRAVAARALWAVYAARRGRAGVV